MFAPQIIAKAQYLEYPKLRVTNEKRKTTQQKKIQEQKPYRGKKYYINQHMNLIINWHIEIINIGRKNYDHLLGES